jgi:hypothetical protein
MTQTTFTANDIASILRERDIEPDYDFTAESGQDYGYVAAWNLPSGDVLVQYGNNATTDYAIADVNDSDDLAAWLESDDLNGLDRIVQTANVRGSGEVEEAEEDAEGPFYVLITHDWYGPTETSSIAMDEYGQNNLEFATWQDAQDWIDAADEGIYTLSHNESGAPSYKIVTE